MTIKDVILKEIKGIWGNPPVEGELSTPVIKTNNMTYEGYIDYDDITYRSIPDNKIASCFLKRGDLLVEKSGGTKTHSVGYVNIFNKENDVYVCNNFIVGLRPDNTIILSEYLFFQMKYFYEIGIFSDCYNKTTGIQNLQLQTYLSKPIVCPEKAEQKKVVSTLSNIVKALDNKKEQLKKLDELIQSKFYEMFGDLNGEPTELNKVIDVVSGLVNPNIEPYCSQYHIGPGNIVSNTGEIVDCKLAKDEGLISNKYAFKKGMILYSKIRPNLNKVAIPKFDGICSADMYPLILKESVVDAFIWKLLSSQDFLVYAIKHSGRARMPKLNRETLLAYKFILPPLPLQQAFAAYVEKVEQAKAIVNQEISHLQVLLNSRMDYYFRK